MTPPFSLHAVALAASLALLHTAALAQAPAAPASPASAGAAAVPDDDTAAAPTLAPVEVRARHWFDPWRDADATSATLGAQTAGAHELAPRRSASPDTAGLLQAVPGFSLRGAGGVSGLPVLRGLADERLRVQVDGMDLLAACPNHMNPALSYLDPAQVERVTVFAGITPVSVGGDSIGGTVQVQTASPQFTEPGEPARVSGSVGGSLRSNGRGGGANASVSYATDQLQLRYDANMAQAANYRAARAFKLVAPGTEQGAPIAGDVVASTEFRTRNHKLGAAWRQGAHLLQADVGWQDMPYQGFPNQRMDLTDNRSTQFNLRYNGRYDWGDVQARVWSQRVRHQMDMGPDRYTYGTGMPMLANAATRGAALQANWLASERDTVRVGVEAQRYTLYDWWPAVGASGAMAPNTFWNIDHGRRHRADVFAEWESRPSPRLTTLVGLRHTRVATDTGPVQGYSGLPTWADDAAAFNAQPRRRRDGHWDFTALARYAPADGQRYEAGYARKTRSPSLYQRYAWSTNTMAAGMNNFMGDGNGYIGNADLKPEVAHTLSISGQWQAPRADGGAPAAAAEDAQDALWALSASAYVTVIENYIDAVRCPASRCKTTGNDTARQFVLLQYANQRARLLGLDASGHLRLVDHKATGRWTLLGSASWLRGRNLGTGDGLYNTMPAQLTLGLQQRVALSPGLGGGSFTQTLEWQGVTAKTRVSAVRNELPTAGYGLLNWRASYSVKNLRFDLGVDNLLNKFYDLPLGGAYVGQGSTMMLNTVPWGTAVPGRGRGFYVGMTATF